MYFFLYKKQNNLTWLNFMSFWKLHIFAEEKIVLALFTKQDLLAYLCFFFSYHKVFVGMKSFFTLFDTVKENAFELLQDCRTS